MTFVESIKTCLNKYAMFQGRATRSEFWYFVLFMFLVNIVTSIISPYLTMVAGLALLIPNLAVSVRRLHDTGRSGLNLLWCFLPLIGSIIVLIFFVQDTNRENTTYGPCEE